jgi:hypothetical protein
MPIKKLKAHLTEKVRTRNLLRLNRLLDLEEYDKVAEIDIESEFPLETRIQVLRAVLVILARAKLKDQIGSERLGDKLLFENDFEPYDSNSTLYIKLYIIVVLRGNFPKISKRFNEFEIVEPDYKSVDQDLKSYLTLDVE